MASTSGQDSPACFARRTYSATDVFPTAELTAVYRSLRPHAHQSRKTSLILRMDNFSAGVVSSPMTGKTRYPS